MGTVERRGKMIRLGDPGERERSWRVVMGCFGRLNFRRLPLGS